MMPAVKVILRHQDKINICGKPNLSLIIYLKIILG